MAPLIPGSLHTTAMGILPHEEVDPALELALSLDIPFWPQLPHVSFYEDMYVQAAEHFPGIILFPEANTLRFDTARFYEELPGLLDHWPDLDYFDISPSYSVVYHKFLNLDLKGYLAIRGQMEGPVSFGLKVLDDHDRPIIFSDEVRPLLMDFMARRVQAQLRHLQQKHPRAFMFIDEPGLQFIFSSISGYTDIMGKKDLDRFLSQIDRPRGIHLCGNPEWEFLLNRDLDIVSMDAFTNGEILKAYGKTIKRFLDRGGVICWGIVPTWVEAVTETDLQQLMDYLEELWQALLAEGVDRDLLLTRSLLAPARCCLVNPDRTRTVTQAYGWLRELSLRLREKYRLD
ncbi:MAG: hypothetical protein JRI59_06590 [Deltaproteobacteria bacterium]|nr:hypothetical protein [Deltaproteobacteria bacterium]